LFAFRSGEQEQDDQRRGDDHGQDGGEVGAEAVLEARVGSPMRSYREYCAIAKSLDVIGDRWTLLIVRELALRRACRYTDLRNGCPGSPPTCSPSACATSSTPA
jgi:hypothetical protein